MKVVVALGGNALLQRGQNQSADNQIENVRIASQSLAKIAKEHELLIVHGNGPQVGLLALQNEAYGDVENYPFDILGAETQGMVGYMLQRELKSLLANKNISTIVTQMLVDTKDPAFENPTKFIGPIYTQDQAQKLAKEKGWVVKEDGKAWRRVVPSPQPKEVVEKETIDLLVKNGQTVICAGGGGVPVLRHPDGRLEGVEAVIDKDLSASLLARMLDVDRFIILTDVDAVYDDFGTPNQKKRSSLTLTEIETSHYAAGSMGPKVKACFNFTAATKKPSAIGSLASLDKILSGEDGTQITS